MFPIWEGQFAAHVGKGRPKPRELGSESKLRPIVGLQGGLESYLMCSEHERRWVTFAVKEDELLNPLNVDLFSAIAVMPSAHFGTYLLKQFRHGEGPFTFRAAYKPNFSRMVREDSVGNSLSAQYYMMESSPCKASFS
jgi:hypothetical protein